ncbi:hypothetical protein V494_07570 [Pseudogymnoascus sp. VKM F-4513 (FW-928)]|nr:hypothetical protein V494_07570 [Pseudogymnoascus sp. VKM F-4513 (FW-928)]
MSDYIMAQPFYGSSTSSDFMQPASQGNIHTNIVGVMHSASGNVTAGAPGQNSGYWSPSLYMGQDSAASMTGDGIKEQSRLLGGIQRMRDAIRKSKGREAMVAATSFTAAPYGANVDSNTGVNWTFTPENYYKLLKTLYARNEDIRSCRQTIKKLLELADEQDAQIREAHREIRIWRRISHLSHTLRFRRRASHTATMDAF